MAQAKQFTVQGRGLFPMDMLRYDACWPATGTDVELISVTIADVEGRERWTTPRKVILSSASKPTAERWLSFGWRVL